MMSSLINAMSLVVSLQGVTAEQSIQRNQSLVNQAQDCSAMVEDKQRLNCFDELFKLSREEAQQSKLAVEKNATMSKAVTNSPTLQAPESSNAVVRPQDAVEKFGGEHLEVAKEAAPKLEVVIFTVEKIELTIRKQQRFFFTNGQIWENKTSKELRVDKGDQVLVKDGALSAYYLSKVDGTRSVRVKRVK